MWKWSFPSKQEVIEYRSSFSNKNPIRKDKEEKRRYIKRELNSEFIKDVEWNADAITKARIKLLANSL